MSTVLRHGTGRQPYRKFLLPLDTNEQIHVKHSSLVAAPFRGPVRLKIHSNTSLVLVPYGLARGRADLVQNRLAP